MLFRREQHAGIRDGSVTRSYRLWKRPQVRVGGRYRLGADEWIEVTALREASRGGIRSADARRAGYPSRAALLAALDERAAAGRALYRVDFRYAGRAAPPVPDRSGDLDAEALARLEARLDRMDRGRHGPWTTPVLAWIGRHPGRRAGDLARELGRETAGLKADVRRLKGLGLTIPLDVLARRPPARGR